MKVLVVTGLGGSPSYRQDIANKYRAKGYQVDMVPYWRLNFIEHRGYDIYAGHSMGSILIQSTAWIPSDKIENWGMTTKRGTHKSDFIEGHNKQFGWLNRD